MAEAWRGFKKDGHWDVDVNVRNFIQTNYTPYDGDESFLEGPTEATNKLWGKLQELQKEERAKGGVLDFRSFRRMSVSFTVFWIAKQRSYPV